MSKIPRKSILGTLAVAAIAIAAACGGSDDSGEPTVEEYIEQADAICARYDDEFNALANPTSQEEVRPYLAEILRIGQEQTAELEALEVPSDIADIEAQGRANNDEAVERLEGAIERIDGGEDVGVIVEEVTTESARIDQQNQEVAQEIGLEVCGADDDNGSTTSTTGTPPDDTLGDPDPEPTTAEEPADTVEDAAAQYLIDVNAATTSLNEIGAVFTAADDPEALQAQASAIQESVDEFDRAIDSMATYTLDDPQLDRQRAGFVDAGESLEAPLGDLSAAVADGDLEAIAATLPALQEAATEFQEVVAQTP